MEAHFTENDCKWIRKTLREYETELREKEPEISESCLKDRMAYYAQGMLESMVTLSEIENKCRTKFTKSA
jgi:hypothetical protein